jgi:hypothetical protein
MGIRHIEEDDIEVSPTRMWVKVIFLVLVIGVGMYFLTSGSSKRNEQVYKSNETPSRIPSLKPTAGYSMQDVQNESVKLANSTVEKAQDSIGDVLGEVTKKVADQVGDKVEKTASDSAQVVIDYAYKNTVFQGITKMIEALPIHQQNEFQKIMCTDKVE